MGEVVRKDVWNALADAQARGEKRVRVIIGLRGPDSSATVKGALSRLGVKTVLRESQSFLVGRLTRDEIRQVSRLTQHVKAIWLDRPVSATKD
jgi:hypothetical protein